MEDDIAVICITKHGINIARKLKTSIPKLIIYAQSKHNDSGKDITWSEESASRIISSAFKKYSALICIFSLGAVIRLISPLVSSKTIDPAILVVDDKGTFVISALSGHLGGANELTRRVATILNAQPVITTAADVNETIAVDLLGRDLGWTIENFENVTKVSGLVVNEEQVGVFQDVGQRNWWPGKKLPKNIMRVTLIEELLSTKFKGGIIISDKSIPNEDLREKSVIYRPKCLVIGIGLHRDTTVQEIKRGIEYVFQEFSLVFTSVRNIATINTHEANTSLTIFSNESNVPLQLFSKDVLRKVLVPNPSKIVNKFEGTYSVSEASAILSAGGELVVPKHKFPPNLTIAVARVSSDDVREKSNTSNR